jgi:tetratricopeptide (TPR) repeat protein
MLDLSGSYLDSERFRRAVSLRRAGKNEEALQELEALTAETLSDFDKSSVFLAQVTCLLCLNRLNDARERFVVAIKYGRSTWTDLTDACLCYEEGKYNELKKSGNGQDYAEASERLGYLLFRSKEYADAVYRFTEALVFPEPEDRKRQIFLHLGICHLEMKNLDAAEEKLMQSLSRNSGDPMWTEAQYQLGRLYFYRGAYSKAAEAFERCDLTVTDAELKRSISEWLAATAVHLPPETHGQSRPN